MRRSARSSSETDRAALTAWVAALPNAPRGPKDFILRYIREGTEQAFLAKDPSKLPTSREISDTLQMPIRTVRDQLLELCRDGVVDRIPEGRSYAYHVTPEWLGKFPAQER